MFDGDKYLAGETTVGRRYIYWDEFNGHKFLHIRYWYLDKKDDTWKPGPKGIAIREDKVQGVLQGMKAVLELRAEVPTDV